MSTPSDFDPQVLEGLQTVLPAGFGVYDLTEKRLVCSTGWLERKLGYPSEEMSWRAADFFVRLMAHPERDLPRALAQAQALREDREGAVFDNVYALRAADGSVRTFQVRDTVFLRDEQGAATHSFGMFIDITRREVLAKNIQTAEQMLVEVGQFHATELMGFADRILDLLDQMEASEDDQASLRRNGQALATIVHRLAECVELGFKRVARSASPN